MGDHRDHSRPTGLVVELRGTWQAKDVEDAFRIVGSPAAFEYKYDGFRIMINKEKNGKVKIFTRRLEEVTMQFPEIAEYVESHVSGESFILDAEAVGFDAETKKYTVLKLVDRIHL